MIPAKTLLALCLLGVFTSAAHADAKCGPKDTKETQAGRPMCCYTEESKTRACDNQGKTSKAGEYIDCGKTTIKTTKTCVDLLARSRELEKKK